MKVAEAKQIAREWVIENVASRPDFAGAYFYGSAAFKADDEDYSPSSDLDVRIVLDREIPSTYGDPTSEFMPRKLLCRGALLEPVYVSRKSHRDAATVMQDPFSAVALGCFTQPNVILDHTGDLEKLRKEVSDSFLKESWVKRRVSGASDMVSLLLEAALDHGGSLPGYARYFYRQVVWFYGGAMPLAAQIPCIASLHAMTLRKGFLASRELLRRRGRDHLYIALLEVMGVRDATEEEVREDVSRLADAYDYALRVIHTPFWGMQDIQSLCRPMVIDGALEVLDAGGHRGIMPWIAVMRAWVQNAIDNDGSEAEKERFCSEFGQLMMRIGASSASDIQGKADGLKRLLPEIMSLAEEIIADCPDIVHGM